jgi:aerobic carbon-monoxide dehydrogenase medium subunit
MIPPNFDYAAPTHVDDAIRLISENPGAKILAGGQSLIPMMRFRLADPGLLVDINRVSDLSYIREGDGWLKVGTLTREADLEHSDTVLSRFPLLSDTSRVIADPLVRNQSTLGGNLAHADPANDHPATMVAYGARVVVRGPNGDRTIPVEDFFLGYFTTSIAADELVTEIQIPSPVERSGGAYLKMERKVGDFGTAAVAVQLALDGRGMISQIGIGLTNVGETPVKATQAEDVLRGCEPEDGLIQHAAKLAAQQAQPMADHRGSEAYKRSLVGTLTARALRKALERAHGGTA